MSGAPSAATAVDEVCILLPVYNGAAFLAQQLDSLLGQTHPRWHCLIRDDGSTDGTPGIVDAYCRRHPVRFRRIVDDRGNLGVMRSLDVLACHAAAPYFALCDQDDVWKPEKLARCLGALEGIEGDDGLPALAVSDLVVADAELRPISASFWEHTGNARYARDFGCLPVFNAFPGCTMVGNRALLEAAFPVPLAAPMHDHWIALVAKYGGRTVAVEEGLVLYRQHGRNQLGAGDRRPSLPRRAIARAADLAAFFEQGQRSRTMRLALFEELPRRLASMPGRAAYDAALAAERGGPLARLAFLRRQGIAPARAFVYWLA